MLPEVCIICVVLIVRQDNNRNLIENLLRMSHESCYSCGFMMLLPVGDLCTFIFYFRYEAGWKLEFKKKYLLINGENLT